MININTIDHLNISVKNLKNSVDFYNKVFGLETKETGKYRDNDYAIIGSSGHVMLALYETPLLPGPGRINHFGIHVKDFDQTLSGIKRLGLETFYGAGEHEGAVVYERSRSVYIRDPDGNEIELSEKFGGDL